MNNRLVPSCSLLAALFVTLVAGSTRAEPVVARPDRHGFTIELGLGVSFTSVSTTIADAPNVVRVVGDAESPLATKSYAQLGLAPLSLGMGWFLSRDFAVGARITSTSFFPVSDSSDHKFVQVLDTFVGAAAQYWISDDFFLGAGVGLGRYGTNPFLSAVDSFGTAGLAFMARAGYSFYATEHQSFAVVLELVPALYHRDEPFVLHQETSVLGTSLALQWQHF